MQKSAYKYIHGKFHNKQSLVSGSPVYKLNFMQLLDTVTRRSVTQAAILTLIFSFF